MFELDFMGLAVLDPEFSRPMLPWVVREVIFRAEPHKVNLSVDNDQVKFQDANDSSPKVENSFQSDGYKIKDVYHPAHEPTSFAFVTREAASTPCSCYVFKNESVELVEQIVKKLKHEIGSGKRKRLGETSGESEVISYEVLLLNKTPIYTEKPSQDIIDNLIEQSKSQSATSTRPESANGTNEFSVDISTRNRGLISSDISTGVSDDRAGRSVIENKRKEFTRQRSHSYDTSNYKHENKTKIFQIGIDRLTVIDTDGPGVIDVKFTRVSRCVQGVKHPNSFGFVARDPRKRAQVNGNTGGQMEFYFYIFECFDEQTCEDIMGAIKQAFSASMRPITPLHTFHRLCVRLNHTQDLNQRLSLVSGVIEQISEGEKFYIDQKLKSLTPGSGTERLVFQVSVLREIFEVKNREMQLSMSSSKKSPIGQGQGINVKKVEDLANRLGSKFSLLSRNMTQNIQTMSDKLGESGMNLADKVRTARANNSQRPDSRVSLSNTFPVEQNSVISDERRTNGLSTPVRDLEEVSFESNDIDSVQHFSPAKSLRQQIYESVSSNATVSNSPRPSYKDKEIKKDLSTPDSIRNSLHQIEEENALLERIKQRISELEKMSPEEAGPLQQKLWADLGLDTVAAESKVNGAGEGRKNETVKLIPPGVIHAATSHAVPEEIRGEVWKFLIKQREHRHGVKFTSSFKTLINQLAPPGQAHSILIDLCRTFPKHRQFRESLAQSSGQKSLYNVLKAYCLLDDEVGYCQGLSFVVGLILIYLPAEEDAFAVLRHLMFECNMRRFYMPDMAALQEAMYQLSRLLAELEPTLYEFLESHCVTPVLYLTPWFLTLFASNFPMSFSSRVLDKWQSLTE
ncbi:Oidioi.mRNA.OKI2018_I69.chr2.g6469.t2.cds [Oikopleura dioica]|uniref:Oidioi.mRNA.OKI2018_I69.chr2.g6469.t2.cds n=1 Tax=Oikopleura dioica TaxID=34765 RepID=A0ABN7T6R6_OIKDI|nr:Oidioi.mRNA.OKI2018_I69.chr2.g6469.t2.cds [Oikopleura dioica]